MNLEFIPYNEAIDKGILKRYEEYYYSENRHGNRYIEHPDEVRAKINAGIIYFWCTDDLIILTEVHKDDINNHVVIGSIVGKDATKIYKECLGSIEEWAKSIGCRQTLTLSRKAWVKLLPDYKVERYLLVKDL